MKNKKIIILSSIIIGILVLTFSLSYAVLTFNKTSGNSELVLGDIYMHYGESNSISLQNAMPGDLYDIDNPNSYFEFTISGKNTYTKKDIWYDINVTRGDVPSGKVEGYRIPDEYLKFRLVEVVDGEEKEIFTNKTYNHITNRKIYIDTISKNTTSEINKTYRLYMTISSSLKIGNSADAVYTTETWEEAFASIKVNVTGDFNEKQMPNTMARLGTANANFWSNDIINVKSNITEVNFIQLDNDEIDTRYNASSIKSDVTSVSDYPIKLWLETNETDSTKYTMYVASDEEMYFPSNSSWMFYGFKGLETINFENINTSYATDISRMFYNCPKLNNLNLSNFDTSKVTDISYMFMDCSNLTSLDLSNFNTASVVYMTHVFYNCSKLTGIEGLNNFDTSQVKWLYHMFYGCSSLTNLDLSSFNTSKVDNFDYMFYNCVNLTSLDISSFTFDKVNQYNMSMGYQNRKVFESVGSNLPEGTYTTVYVGADYELDGTTYSPQNFILNLPTTIRPSGWSSSNVIVKQ